MPGDLVAGTAGQLVVQDIDGAPRIRDTDLAERLGFSKPANIRKLIPRHRGALPELGTFSTVENANRGNKMAEYWLNRKQAVFITAKSETSTAAEITMEVVRRFDEYERGLRPAAPVAFNINDRTHLLAIAGQLSAALPEEREKVAELERKAAALASCPSPPSSFP